MTLKSPTIGALASVALLLLVSCGNVAEHETRAAPPAGVKNAAAGEELLGEGVSPKVATTILKVFKDNMDIDETMVTSIQKSPIDNLYEVVIQKMRVFYSTGDGKYLIDGDIVDVDNKINHTEERIRAINKVDVSALPVGNAIVTTLGEGGRDLYVFADPDCPFCKLLHRNLLKMDNLKVRTFLMGMTDLHPLALEHAERIMCQKDPSETWNQWTLSSEREVEKVVPEAEACETGIKENQKVSEMFRVSGTPTVIFPDGTKISGALSPDEIERLFEKYAAKK